MAQGGRILVVDDEPHIRKVLKLMLSRAGHEVVTAGGGAEALKVFEADTFDVVILDLRMPDIDGLEVLRRIRTSEPNQSVVMITAYASLETAIEAMKQGAFDYITKPFKEEEILVVVDKALERNRLLADNRRLMSQAMAGEIVAESRGMREVLRLVEKVAPTTATVLITGESGTGKELVARAIHARSHRASRALVAVNCAAIPPSLIEAELFGAAKGAFTGAERPRKGLFEEAHGSSLFLDEVAELPLDVQAKLLRALQDGEVRRVGENIPRKVDIRVIAATNRDLEKMVAEGRFREDLYYRLNVIPIHIPPLRERPEDIPPLATRFLAQACARYGQRPKRITPEAMELLITAPWKGNVRQLANLMEQLALMVEGEEITSHHLAPALGLPTSAASLHELVVHIPPHMTELKKVLKSVTRIAEEQVVRRALEASRGNRTRAAQLLGISRRALITKIQQLGLAEPRV